MTAAVRRAIGPGHSRFQVSVTDARGRAIRRGPAAGLGAWLVKAAPRRVGGRVAVAIISDSDIRHLNQTYRRKNHATDVLSFPARPNSAGVLGDLAIARGVAARQAREFEHSVRVELRILALHGLLHLLGYDHETDHGEMARLEARVRRKMGLPSGLIGRPAAP